ncbi:oligopeptide/dipeptide ABC transporter ATP-binding protein [Oricola sp.]|uniref:oligopeptide/dipeptide ABC transporter ATP-binding protein n=1 Tax=Oricola sp. TaxID=1979950 RepID=UPI0025FAF149|nr:oligopeptide/dipeptide ABC transporter ATP-binding protein [Oricola sp.]MCI5078111.1 ATP-binding cassette domain-containing protein [Oricola sp.]
MSEPVLSTRGLGRVFRVRGHDGPAELHALSEIEITCHPGRSLGVLGESGCGKTTLNRILLALDKPTTGEVAFRGKALGSLSRREMRDYRRSVQPVFQNPFSSLNPRMRVKHIVAEPLVAATGMSRADIRARVAEVLSAVGLPPEDGERFPNQFSGGQRQRIAIARAISSSPQLLLLDEPVSSQDISIRAQILNLLKELQEDFGIGSVFVSHDLATVRFMCDEVIVIYLGRIVEHGPVGKICETPDHPYTRALLAAALPADPDRQEAGIKPIGEIPSPLDPPAGCAYHPRCPFARDICKAERPRLTDPGDGSQVACHMTHAKDW